MGVVLKRPVANLWEERAPAQWVVPELERAPVQWMVPELERALIHFVAQVKNPWVVLKRLAANLWEERARVQWVVPELELAPVQWMVPELERARIHWMVQELERARIHWMVQELERALIHLVALAPKPMSLWMEPVHIQWVVRAQVRHWVAPSLWVEVLPVVPWEVVLVAQTNPLI